MTEEFKHDFISEYPYLVQTNAQTLVYTNKADVHYEPDITVEALTVTENDVYTAPEGKAYSPVTVNVAGGGSSPHSISCFTTDESFNLTPFEGNVQSAAINEETGEWGPSGTEINTANTGDIVYGLIKNVDPIVGYMITVEDTPFIQIFIEPIDEIGIFMPDADLSVIYADMQ